MPTVHITKALERHVECPAADVDAGTRREALDAYFRDPPRRAWIRPRRARPLAYACERVRRRARRAARRPRRDVGPRRSARRGLRAPGAVGRMIRTSPMSSRAPHRRPPGRSRPRKRQGSESRKEVTVAEQLRGTAVLVGTRKGLAPVDRDWPWALHPGRQPHRQPPRLSQRALPRRHPRSDHRARRRARG